MQPESDQIWRLKNDLDFTNYRDFDSDCMDLSHLQEGQILVVGREKSMVSIREEIKSP